MHVLLVEDDAPLAASIAAAIAARGGRVDTSDRGEPVPHSVQRDAYDVVVLDLGLSGIDGLETLRGIRAAGSTVPVLVLTARDGIADRVTGLEAGADDYLVKPFALSELLARLHALARRQAMRRGDVQRLGDLRFDARARQAWAGERPLHLTAREAVVLPYLLLRAGEVVTREQVTALIPGWDAAQSENALDLLVSRLRAKVEPAGVRLRTVRGLGYRLEAAEPDPADGGDAPGPAAG
jgi:DNA-binding response OmpR family regulator